jgi:hypothetical protein
MALVLAHANLTAKLAFELKVSMFLDALELLAHKGTIIFL